MQIAEKIDEYGQLAWIGLMVAAFIVFWPFGLAMLAFLIWSGRMGCSKRKFGRWHNDGDRRRRWSLRDTPSSGNAAFDEYRDETLQRLEEEQKEFHEFLNRLRQAKDKAEFDQFMSDRSRPAGPTGPTGSTGPTGPMTGPTGPMDGAPQPGVA